MAQAVQNCLFKAIHWQSCQTLEFALSALFLCFKSFIDYLTTFLICFLLLGLQQRLCHKIILRQNKQPQVVFPPLMAKLLIVCFFSSQTAYESINHNSQVVYVRTLTSQVVHCCVCDLHTVVELEVFQVQVCTHGLHAPVSNLCIKYKG